MCLQAAFFHAVVSSAAAAVVVHVMLSIRIITTSKLLAHEVLRMLNEASRRKRERKKERFSIFVFLLLLLLFLLLGLFSALNSVLEVEETRHQLNGYLLARSFSLPETKLTTIMNGQSLIIGLFSFWCSSFVVSLVQC